MPVDPRLLTLQEHDSTADRLRRAIASIPEAAALTEARARLAEVEARYGAGDAERGGHEAELRRLDDEVAKLRAKRDRESGKLASGSITNARELSALHAEVESLDRRIAELEDAELEAMERVEALAPGLAEIERERAALQAEIEDLRARVAETGGDLEGQLAAAESARVEAAAVIDTALLDRYERARERSVGGIGVARLVDGSCQGCHVKLAAGEVVEVMETELPRCPSCGALLVTGEAP